MPICSCSVCPSIYNFIPLFNCVCISICLSVHPSFLLSIAICLCFFFYLSFHISIPQSIHLLVWISFCLSYHSPELVVSVCLSFYVPVFNPPLVCLFVYLSAGLSISLSVCLSFYPTLNLSRCLFWNF